MVRIGLLAVVLGLGLTGTAQAGLEICNHTGELQSISIGYKGETDWTSEGWWNIEPGNCAELVSGDLTKRYYYYHADSKSDRFRGQDFIFCTRRDEFTIVGDSDCDDRGYDSAEFREIDTGETATSFTLTLVAEGGGSGNVDTGARKPGADVAKGDDADVATQTVTETVEVPVVTVDETALQTDMPPGRNGEPFKTMALFQGCELEDGRAYCGFHAKGVKLRAYHKGPTPQDLMYALEGMKVNTPVLVEGDRVDSNRMHVSVVLRSVTPKPGEDARAALRRRMQGEWALESDPRSEITIRGSEIHVRYAGNFRVTRFLELLETCEGLRGEGPVMVQTSLRDMKPKCYRVTRADGRVLYLEPVKGGKPIRFRRPG